MSRVTKQIAHNLSFVKQLNPLRNMPAKINRTPYNIATATHICTEPSPDGDDSLYRTRAGRFFIEEMSCYVDGVKIRPDQSPEDVAPELAHSNMAETSQTVHQWRLERVRYKRKIIPLSDREAMLWCVNTQIPDCFRGCVLDRI